MILKETTLEYDLSKQIGKRMNDRTTHVINYSISSNNSRPSI